MGNSRGIVTSKPVDRVRETLTEWGLARARDLERSGISRTQLQRMVEAGVVERVARGLYGLPDTARTEHQHLAEATRRVPGSVVCLLSALRFHGLTTQNPFEVWLAIGRKAWRPRVEHPPIRLVYLSAPALEAGVAVHQVGGTAVPVFSAAKTVADCFKFRNKIGTEVAVEALRDYRRLHPRGLEAVWRFAQVDRVARVIQPYLESLQ